MTARSLVAFIAETRGVPAVVRGDVVEIDGERVEGDELATLLVDYEQWEPAGRLYVPVGEMRERVEATGKIVAVATALFALIPTAPEKVAKLLTLREGIARDPRDADAVALLTAAGLTRGEIDSVFDP